MTDYLLDLDNAENDPFVKEIFELAETEEVKKMAQERFEKYKSEHPAVELKEADIFKVLNASYIAERFFGKSRYWISQRLNHNKVNGKVVKFSPEEYKTLKNALETISSELQELADSM